MPVTFKFHHSRNLSQYSSHNTMFVALEGRTGSF